jgi:formiminotetrahydrofolate cyclodeaminase
MRLSEQRFIDLLRLFRSSNPTPGGGSASALSGAVGASLLAMVAGLPKPRAHTPDDVRSLTEAGSRAASMSERLALLMDRDSEAYELVVAAFRLPKNSAEEKTARSGRIQEALRAATEAPLDVMHACAEAIQMAAVVARLGNTNASSDVRVGLELLAAGLRGARLNVSINLTSMKDRDYIEATTAAADQLAARAEEEQAAAIRALEAVG